MAKRVVVGTEKDDGVLVAVCFKLADDTLGYRTVDGVARDILAGDHTYVVKRDNKVETPIRVTIRTHPDETEANNLLELPNCHKKSG